jgi:excisionase family DNA binding protein
MDMSSQVDDKDGPLVTKPEVFSLDAVIADPSRAATLSPEIAQSILISLATIHPILLQRALTASQDEHEEDLLTIPQVAKRLKVSDYRAYELARQGFLKSVRLGKSVRIKQSALVEYLADQES